MLRVKRTCGVLVFILACTILLLPAGRICASAGGDETKAAAGVVTAAPDHSFVNTHSFSSSSSSSSTTTSSSLTNPANKMHELEKTVYSMIQGDPSKTCEAIDLFIKMVAQNARTRNPMFRFGSSTDCVKHLIKRGVITVNAAFQWAVESGNIRALHSFVMMRKFTKEEAAWAVGAASRRGYAAVIQFLTITFEIDSKAASNAFHSAAENDHVEVMCILLERRIVPPECMEQAFVAATKNGALSAVIFLLHKYGHLTKLAIERALCLAAQNGHNEVLSHILSNIDVDVEDVSAALISAVLHGQMDTTMILLSTGVVTERAIKVALAYSIEENYVAITQLLLKELEEI